MATLPVLTPTSDTGALTALWGTPLNDFVAWTRTGGTWAQSSAPALAQYPNFVNQTVPTAEADGQTGLVLNTNNGASAFSCLFDNTPSDFLSMDTLSATVSLAYPSAISDDEMAMAVAIRRASDGLALAAWSNSSNGFEIIAGYDGSSYTSGSSQTPSADGLGTRIFALDANCPTPPAYDHSRAFTYVNTSATKSDWDNARLCIYSGIAKNMGADSPILVLVDIQIEGTYTQSAAGTTVTPVGSTSLATSATAQLTVTTPPASITPVGSTSLATSATAQLTATYLPTTVTPTGSTSLATSATGQLTVSDPPTTVTPTGSTSLATSATAQLTTSWPVVTVTPTGSTALATSATAQLTVTGGAPPTTVTPVGTSSLATSATAQLTSPNTSLASSDLAGVPGNSGEVVLTWSEPVGVQS